MILTKEEQLKKKRIYEVQKQKQLAAAVAKKQRMLRITESKKKNVPQTEDEKLKRKRKAQVIQKAADLRNEDRDDVKEMNKMIMYAKVVTIRDKQLAQKKFIHGRFVEEEK